MGEALRARRFELRSRLGAGGAGTVHAAWDHERGELVALKTLHQVSPSALLRLKTEFRAAADLRHPGLVPLYELFAEGTDCFFTMELVEGVPLSTWLLEDTPPPSDLSGTMTIGSLADAGEAGSRRVLRACPTDVDRLRAVVLELVGAVGALHDQGKIHRDLKPSNVLVRADGRVRVLDYGLLLDVGSAQAGVFHGTPAYAAPEQALEGGFGPEVDAYAIGVMIFEALTGTLPFVGSPLQILAQKSEREAPSVDTMVAAPPDLVALVRRLLARAPAERATLGEIAATLGGARPTPEKSAERPLVGRAAELAVLDLALAAAERGEDRRLLLRGPSGIGKSTLVRAFVARAAARGFCTLVGRCHHRESVPFNALDGVIDGLAQVLVDTPADPKDLALAGGLFPVLAGDNAGPSEDPALQRSRAVDALGRVLAAVARARRVALVVDDVQWADADSRALLADLFARPIPHCTLVLAGRDGAEKAWPWAITEVPIPPLGGAAAEALARSCGAEGARARSIAEASGGHPMFVQELTLDRTGTAASLDDAVRSRVASLPARTRRVVELLSVAAGPISERALLLAAEIPVEARAGLVTALAADRVARFGEQRRGRAFATVEPFHDRVREAVSAGLDEAGRRSLHAALHRGLTAAGLDEVELTLAHLDGAGQTAEASRLAAEVARRADQAFAFDRAADLYREAMRLGNADPSLPGLHAQALARGHRAKEAAEAFVVVGRRDPTRRREAMRRAAELFLVAGEQQRGIDLLRTLLVERRMPLPETTLGALAALLREWVDNRVPLRRPLSEDDATLLRTLSQGLGMSDHVRAAVYQQRWFGAAMRAPFSRHAGQAIAMEALFRGSTGPRGRRRAEPLMAMVDDLAAKTGDPETACWAFACRVLNASFAGESTTVIDDLATAERMFRERTEANTWPITSLQLLRAFRVRIGGDFVHLRKILPEILNDARRRGDRYLETTMRRGANVLFLCDDDVAGSERMLEELRWDAPLGGYQFQHYFAFEAAAENLLYQGEGHRILERHGDALSAVLLSHVERQQPVRALSRSLWGRAWLARAERGLDVTRAVVTASVLARGLLAEGYPDAIARGHLLRAGVAAVRGSDPAPALRAAIDWAERYSLLHVGAAAHQRLAECSAGAAARAHAEAAARYAEVHGIRRPAAMTDVCAPGFRRR